MLLMHIRDSDTVLNACSYIAEWHVSGIGEKFSEIDITLFPGASTYNHNHGRFNYKFHNISEIRQFVSSLTYCNCEFCRKEIVELTLGMQAYNTRVSYTRLQNHLDAWRAWRKKRWSSL